MCIEITNMCKALYRKFTVIIKILTSLEDKYLEVMVKTLKQVMEKVDIARRQFVEVKINRVNINRIAQKQTYLNFSPTICSSQAAQCNRLHAH